MLIFKKTNRRLWFSNVEFNLQFRSQRQMESSVSSAAIRTLTSLQPVWSNVLTLEELLQLIWGAVCPPSIPTTAASPFPLVSASAQPLTSHRDAVTFSERAAVSTWITAPTVKGPIHFLTLSAASKTDLQPIAMQRNDVEGLKSLNPRTNYVLSWRMQFTVKNSSFLSALRVRPFELGSI